MSPILPAILLRRVLFLVCLLTALQAFPGCSGGRDNPSAPAPAGSGGEGGSGGSGGGSSTGTIGSLAETNSDVMALASDGGGGLYVGGLFTQVGNVDRPYLAHVLASGEVDQSWNPQPSLS